MQFADEYGELALTFDDVLLAPGYSEVLPAATDLRTRLIKAQLQGSRKYYSEEDLDILHSRMVQDTFRADSMAGALLVSTIPGTLISIGLFFVLLSLNLTLSLVCVDHRLGGRTGLEFLESLRQRYPQVPSILFTGQAAPWVEQRAQQVGARVLWKPIRLSQWLGEVQALLAS